MLCLHLHSNTNKLVFPRSMLGNSIEFCLGEKLQVYPMKIYRYSISLVPSHSEGEGRENAWYTLFAHACISKISQKLGYSSNLPCNFDIIFN